MAAALCNETLEGDLPGRRYGWVELPGGGRARVLLLDNGRPVVSELRRLGLASDLAYHAISDVYVLNLLPLWL